MQFKSPMAITVARQVLDAGQVSTYTIGDRLRAMPDYDLNIQQSEKVLFMKLSVLV